MNLAKCHCSISEACMHVVFKTHHCLSIQKSNNYNWYNWYNVSRKTYGNTYAQSCYTVSLLHHSEYMVCDSSKAMQVICSSELPQLHFGPL